MSQQPRSSPKVSLPQQLSTPNGAAAAAGEQSIFNVQSVVNVVSVIPSPQDSALTPTMSSAAAFATNSGNGVKWVDPSAVPSSSSSSSAKHITGNGGRTMSNSVSTATTGASGRTTWTTSSARSIVSNNASNNAMGVPAVGAPFLAPPSPSSRQPQPQLSVLTGVVAPVSGGSQFLDARGGTSPTSTTSTANQRFLQQQQQQQQQSQRRSSGSATGKHSQQQQQQQQQHSSSSSIHTLRLLEQYKKEIETFSLPIHIQFPSLSLGAAATPPLLPQDQQHQQSGSKTSSPLKPVTPQSGPLSTSSLTADPIPLAAATLGGSKLTTATPMVLRSPKVSYMENPLKDTLTLLRHDQLVEHCTRLHYLLSASLFNHTDISGVGTDDKVVIGGPLHGHGAAIGGTSSPALPATPSASGAYSPQVGEGFGLLGGDPLGGETTPNSGVLQPLLCRGGSGSGGNVKNVSFGGGILSARFGSNTSLMSQSFRPVVQTETVRKSVDEDGMKTLNEYVIIQELGSGSCGKVKAAFDSERCKMVAIKIVKKVSQSNLQGGLGRQAGAVANYKALQREIAVMKKLRHKHIVALYEVIDDPEAHKLYLIMQYVDKGPIGKIDPKTLRCDPVPMDELGVYARQLCAGLAYLHKHKIVHRDIKPENILVDSDGNAYLADFGVSEMFESRSAAEARGTKGTKLFMSPELIQEGCGMDGFALDVWALGVTLYSLLTGHLPFESEEEILKKEVDCKREDSIPPQWGEFLHDLLSKDPKKRPSILEVRQRVKKLLTDCDGPRPGGGFAPAALNISMIEQDATEITYDDIENAITPMASAALSRKTLNSQGSSIPNASFGGGNQLPNTSMSASVLSTASGRRGSRKGGRRESLFAAMSHVLAGGAPGSVPQPPLSAPPSPVHQHSVPNLLIGSMSHEPGHNGTLPVAEQGGDGDDRTQHIPGFTDAMHESVNVVRGSGEGRRGSNASELSRPTAANQHRMLHDGNNSTTLNPAQTSDADENGYPSALREEWSDFASSGHRSQKSETLPVPNLPSPPAEDRRCGVGDDREEDDDGASAIEGVPLEPDMGSPKLKNPLSSEEACPQEEEAQQWEIKPELGEERESLRNSFEPSSRRRDTTKPSTAGGYPSTSPLPQHLPTTKMNVEGGELHRDGPHAPHTLMHQVSSSTSAGMTASGSIGSNYFILHKEKNVTSSFEASDNYGIAVPAEGKRKSNGSGSVGLKRDSSGGVTAITSHDSIDSIGAMRGGGSRSLSPPHLSVHSSYNGAREEKLRMRRKLEDLLQDEEKATHQREAVTRAAASSTAGVGGWKKEQKQTDLSRSNGSRVTEEVASLLPGTRAGTDTFSE